MTYTPIKTWSTGDVLTGDDLNNELIGLKKYTHRVGTTDLKNAQFIDTQHIMPGTIDAQTNVTHNCTGMFGGQSHSYQSLNYTFVTKFNSNRSANTLNNIFIPETAFTINIGRPATTLFSWWIQEKTDTFSGTNLNNFFVGANTKTPGIIPNGTHVSTSRSNGENISTSSTVVYGDLLDGTNYLSGFTTLEGSSINFFLGLTGRATSHKSQVMSWGVCLELFYM
tara:strand:- start:1296 stop:1967 length:672 start_codon:yes stop_codon:yes gene_type:complete